MNWQDSDMLWDDTPKPQTAVLNDGLMVDENEQKTLAQLKKFQDPLKDMNRHAYTALITTFGDLLVKNNIEELAKRFLHKDCKTFLFSAAERFPIQCIIGHEGFINLYKDVRVTERRVRQTYVDSEKSAAFQVCNCKIFYGESESYVDEVTFEAFNIREGKISKYRVWLGVITPSHGTRDFFETTVKDRMIARVKEINYAIAGQPDWGKVASLLNESTEYKIWSWDSGKCFVFRKEDLATSFKNLEENYRVKSVVPYEIYMDREFIVGNYVYYLEKRGCSSGKDFMWLSTCVYSFDQNLNISKISQQGELFFENEIPIPFESYSREWISERTRVIAADYKMDLDLFYKDEINFNCDLCQFGNPKFPTTGYFEGIKSYTDIVLEKLKNEIRLDWIKVVDIFVDHHDPSYDVAITVNLSHGTFFPNDYRYSGKFMNFVSVIRWIFENGKATKILVFLVPIPEPIPSPFDDGDFQDEGLINCKY